MKTPSRDNKRSSLRRLRLNAGFKDQLSLAVAAGLANSEISKVLSGEYPSYHFRDTAYHEIVICLAETLLKGAPNGQGKYTPGIQSYEELLDFLKTFLAEDEYIKNAMKTLSKDLPDVIGNLKEGVRMLPCTAEEEKVLLEVGEMLEMLLRDPSQWSTIRDRIPEIIDLFHQVINKIRDRDIE